MATVQTSKVAIQYGQRYVPSNGASISGVSAVAVQPESRYVETIQLQQQQQQQHQPAMPVTEKPTILNHMLLNGGSTVNLSNVEIQPQIPQQQLQQQQIHESQQQHQQQFQQPPSPKLWILVEWESPAGEPHSYSAIDSSELVLHSQTGNTRETIHTGKTIFVKRGKKLVQATVVMIADDKEFIDTEMRQLRKIALENHYRTTVTYQDHNTHGTVLEQQAKRRRIEATTTGSDDHDLASPEFEPMPTQSTHVATANWVNNCKVDRVLSPTPSVLSAQVHTASHHQNQKPPPMTFDQQTQTDSKFFPQENENRSSQPELAKILSLLETILTEQKTIRMETEYNRKLTFDMMEQQQNFSETMKHLVTKIESVEKYEITEVVKNPEENVSSYVVLGTGGEESRDRPASVAESTVQKPRISVSNNTTHNLVIDQISIQEDSNISFHTKYSVQDESSSITSTPKNLNFTNRLSSSALSLSNTSTHSQGSNTVNASTNNATNNSFNTAINEMLKEWTEDAEAGDDNEPIPIGPNYTMVKKQILRAINWNNYKAATRKLLMTLFSREMLASHTLTGRPSPAFMGDRAKPVKDKLDQKIIADIIAMVTKTCNVSEPMVRTAITTKCADENKMSRMKHGKGGATTAQPSINGSSIGDKSLATSAEPAAENATAHSSPYPKRVKRENKENVQ